MWLGCPHTWPLSCVWTRRTCLPSLALTARVPWPVTMVPFGKRPKRLPTVLSRQAVDELLRCTENLKHRTFFSTLYACGMRISEAAHWQISDIDSARMQIRIARGKGAKERRVPLSPRLLEELSELALANRMEMADLLVTAAWKSLRKTTREQQDD